MGFGDYLSNVWNNTKNDIGGVYDWLSGNKGTEAAGTDRSFLDPYMQQGNPYINRYSPQAGNYNGLMNNQNALIKMLQGRVAGEGPSVAGDAYKQASENAMAQTMALSNGGNPAAARQAGMNLGNIQQGQAQGYATARNQEMQGATGQLGGVMAQLGNTIGAADQSTLSRDKANQDAWLQMLAQKFGLTRAELGGKTNADNLSGIGQGIGKAIAAFG